MSQHTPNAAAETAAKVLRHLDILERCEGWTDYWLPLLEKELLKVEKRILEAKPSADGTWNPTDLIKDHANRELLESLISRAATDRAAQESVLRQSAA